MFFGSRYVFLSFEVMLYTLLTDKNWRVYMVSLGDALIRYSGVHFLIHSGQLHDAWAVSTIILQRKMQANVERYT